MPYKGTNNIDPNKVFLVNFSEVYGGRLDVDYYKPDIAYLEDTISSLSTKRLKDFCISVNGGATPKTDEQEKYYSDSEHGIPFLRVQNLQVSGELSLENCNYINEETHNGLLKRSQVYEGYLLVKITGVGRMAIASVAPNGFVGNINQHIVAIKTGNKEISKYLARYLNTDIVEKIASRHATGGTRPALDYPSLLNIPIIENIDFTPIDKAIQFREQIIKQAQRLQDSIDQYLLDELGITLPEKDNSLENRLFTVKFSKVCDGRFDPCWQIVQHEKMFSNKYQEYSIKTIATLQKGTSITSDEIIKGDYPVIAGGQTSPYTHNEYNFEGNVITISASGAYSGYVWYHDEPIFASDCTVLWSNDENTCLTIYLFEVLRLKQQELYNLQQGAGQPHVYPQDIGKVLIPLPPIEKQREISENIAAIRAEAKRLELEGEEILESARQQVEQMILGDSCQSNGERKN